ncbi:N-sulfoglucosamine sulfohydrolase [Catalinimonas alkaloidigena]|uniref:sulfatase family protein n=1 Tax=Catalinimonas alkaloidigena TaxID=1075417 RepID=UPI00240561EC|nr:sulfatase [Catalinimonas alkaloidigena]MDF9795433.1 N-sulfoglucosamine sulfohydrolase [Catalinimonas alkaloidigena]
MKKYSSTLLIILLGLFTPWQLKAQTQPMNVLWIIAEDLSPDLKCYGNSLVNTPHLDSLAAHGMRFTEAFSAAPVCSPSRTAFATGMYQTSIGAYHMRYPEELLPELSEGIKTVAQIVNEQGYTSANIKDVPGKGKIDWMFKHEPGEHFNAEHWQEIAEKNEPFFAQVSLGLTHRPFEEPQPGQFDLDKISIPPYYPDHTVSRKDFAGYYASIEKLDEQVGMVLDSLKKYGLDENTAIIFFSDHGRPMTRGKNYHYDSGLRVPLIISLPPDKSIEGYTEGQTSDQLHSLIDVTATSLKLMQIPRTEYEFMQGRVFLGEHQEEESAYVFSASNRIGGTDFRSRSVRSENFRYTRNYHHDFSVNSSATAYRKQMHPIYHLLNIMHEQGTLTPAQEALVEDMPYEELYELKNDPYETVNLIEQEEYAQELSQLRKALDDWIKETSDQGLGEDNDEIKAAFQQYHDASHNSRKEKIEQLHQEVLHAVSRE